MKEIMVGFIENGELTKFETKSPPFDASTKNGQNYTRDILLELYDMMIFDNIEKIDSIEFECPENKKIRVKVLLEKNIIKVYLK